MPDGRFSNLYTVKVVNKTSRALPVEFRLEKPAGTLQVMGPAVVVPPERLVENSVLIELDPDAMKPGATPLAVGVYLDGKRVQLLKTSFLGPRTARIPSN